MERLWPSLGSRQVLQILPLCIEHKQEHSDMIPKSSV